MCFNFRASLRAARVVCYSVLQRVACYCTDYHTDYNMQYSRSLSITYRLRGSGVAYGIDRYLLAQSTKFGSHILRAKAKLFGGVPDFKGQGQGQVKVKF